MVAVATACDGGGGSPAPDARRTPDATRVSDDESAATCVSAIGLAEGFVAAWTDFREPEPQLSLHRFDSDGTPLGSDVRISALGSPRFAACPAFARGPSGALLVFNSNYGVRVQRLDASGEPLGEPIAVVDGGGFIGLAIAADDTGFGVVWSTPSRTANPFFARSGSRASGSTDSRQDRR